MNLKKIISKYPKKRVDLPIPLKKIFNKYYLNNRKNYLSQLIEKWLHLSINDRWTKKNTLEIGAGTLNHLPYESKKNYDIIEPKKFLYKNSKYKKLINKIFKNIKNCKNNYYDRIISCAVLEHMTNLPEYLCISSLKMKDTGYQQHSIPCEGYPVWNITWFLFSGVLFKIKYGYSFKHIMNHEHLNNLDEVISLVSFFYSKVKIKYSYPFFNKYLSFYANIKFSNPKKNNIKRYLDIIKKNSLHLH